MTSIIHDLLQKGVEELFSCKNAQLVAAADAKSEMDEANNCT